MAVFNWTPDYGFEREMNAKVTTIEFGDGYEQRRTHGINTVKSKWTLTFANRSITTIKTIKAFLEARKGLESFDFVAPDGVTYKVRTDGETICKVTDSDYNAQSLTTTFKQVFE